MLINHLAEDSYDQDVQAGDEKQLDGDANTSPSLRLVEIHTASV
jgi:hypothetical protein